MSLVEQHPSTVISLKLSLTASRKMRVRVAGSQGASVVRRASIVAMFGASIAAPFAMPPTLNPPASTWISFETVSVVIMATAAREAASVVGPSAETRCGVPDSIRSTGNLTPISPVWHTRTSSGADPMPDATSSHISSAAAQTISTGLGIGVTTRADHRRGTSRRLIEMGSTHEHRRRLCQVAGEDPGCGSRLFVLGGYECEIGRTRCLDPTRHPGRQKSTGAGDAHGYTPASGSPVTSGRPRARLAHWTA